MRLNDWQERLATEIKAARKKSFAYGTFDCCLFAADCAKAITGIDYASELRGYETKEEAYEIVARYGSLEAMITALLGRDPIHPAMATVGDVVIAKVMLADGEDGEAIGVCTGVNFRAPAARGLASFPMSAARLAWRVE